MNVLVSVVIPSYNYAHLIGRAIQSVLDQSYPYFEVIIVDNHSNDGTDEVIGCFNDSRIRLCKIHNHGVIAASRNMGIQQAQGELIAFLDADDLWYPTKLELCLEKINQGYDMVCHGEHWFGDGCDRKVFYGPEARASYASLLFFGNCLSTSAVVLKRNLLLDINGFNEQAEMITAEDYDLWLRLARIGAKIGFVAEILGEYTLHAGNQTRSVLRNMEAVMYVVNKHFMTYPADKIRLFSIRKRRAIILYGGARSLQDSAAYVQAWRYFFRSICTWPFLPKTYMAMALNLLHKRVDKR
jgi:glycosyltransferase involved in cell wall biosynthesis